MKFYIDKKALIGFTLAVGILVWLGYYSYKNNEDFITTRESILHTNVVLNHIEQTHSSSLHIEETLLRYISSNDSAYLRQYNAEMERATSFYYELKNLTLDNPQQQVLIDSLELLGRNKVEEYARIIQLRAQSKSEAERLINSKEYEKETKTVERILLAMRGIEGELLESRIAQSQLDMRDFQITFFSLVGTNVIILAIVFVTINRSFRARLRAERKMNNVNKELEAFTYSVSHDLRSPLRSIRGFSDVLKEEYGPRMDEEGNRLLDIVMRNASRMGQLIDDLLDFSRLGRKDLTYSDVNMEQLVSEVIQELTVHEKGEVNWDIQPLEDVRGDMNMLKQVWMNLISNALKYSRKVTQRAIRIGYFSENGRGIFFIGDNGVGFDMQYSNKLFNVFQRLHNVNDFEGTGVGLALAHRIISRHNGEIWAEAKVNQGATFFFYIPN